LTFSAPAIVEAPPHALAEPALAAWTRTLRPSTINEMLALMARPGVISFALGLPASELFPTAAFAAAARRVLEASPDALQYRPSHAGLREQVVELMASRGVRCRPEQVLLTTGAQQGLALLARLLLDDGGCVLAESLVYMGFRQVVEPYRPRLLEVGTDLTQGMDVDAVEAHLAGGARPAFIYCITDGHNPLGVSLSPARRARLVELARRYRVPIVEDDAYGLLHYGPAAPPLRAMDERWVFHVGSFSKVLAPGFRVGWIVAPERYVPMLGCAKDGLDLDSATFPQFLISAYLHAGGFAAHVDAVRAEYRARRDAMLRALATHLPPGTRWSVPRHGLVLWAELPGGMETAPLLRAALERDVAFVPGDAFAAHGGRAGASGMRLNFSYVQPERIEQGIARLGAVVRAHDGGRA
jgi:2-aminoadipate transaminase